MSRPVGRGERIGVAAVLLVVPLALLLVAWRDQGGDSGLAAFSPLFFPGGVLWGWAAVAAMALVGELLSGRRTVDDAAAPPEPATEVERGVWWRIGIVVLAMLAFVFLVTELGFLLSAIGFTVITLLALGSRSPLTVIAYGVLMPAVLFGLFHHALGLPLPTSPFSYLF